MHNPHIVPFGDCFICASFAEAYAGRLHVVADAIRESDLFPEVVVAANMITAQYDPVNTTAQEASTVLQQLVEAISMQDLPAVTELATIPVTYDGPDLAAVADHLNITYRDLITLHTTATYNVSMIGFTPGFAYLTGGPAGWSVPRHPTPRQHVAAGSVGLAAQYSGIYPLAGPGGWQIIGHTEKILFHPQTDNPFTLTPNTHVKFVEVA